MKMSVIHLALSMKPDCPFYTHSADRIAERNVEDENEEEYDISYLPLSEKLSGYPDIYEVIGFDKHVLTKLREVDIEDEVVTVWHPGPPHSVNNDLSLDSYFQRKTENTLKIRTKKQTGKITGLFNFMDTEGPLSLSVEECKTISIKFLYTLYPNAEQYFRIASPNEDEEKKRLSTGSIFPSFIKKSQHILAIVTSVSIKRQGSSRIISP